MNPSPDVSVVLVDDDAIVREWVLRSLEDSEFRVAGEASSALEALALLAKRRPGIVLIDFRLPDRAGIELVRELLRHDPSLVTVLMTANRERGFNEAAREAGARGTLLKTGSIDELVGALRSVLAGEDSFDHRFPRRPPGQVALSPREREILRLVAAGTTNREIAAELGIGEQTVKTLVAHAFAKLGARRRTEAVTLARSQGLL